MLPLTHQDIWNCFFNPTWTEIFPFDSVIMKAELYKPEFYLFDLFVPCATQRPLDRPASRPAQPLSAPFFYSLSLSPSLSLTHLSLWTESGLKELSFPSKSQKINHYMPRGFLNSLTSARDIDHNKKKRRRIHTLPIFSLSQLNISLAGWKQEHPPFLQNRVEFKTNLFRFLAFL